jgi:predicted metal-dependent peptidase
MDNKEKLSRAKVLLMPFVEAPNLPIPTLATDGKTIWYHPDWIANNNVDTVKFGVCHEVMHGVFKHMFRRGARDPRIWNMAGDFLINGLLLSERFKVDGSKYLLDDDLVERGGKTTEGIYNLLMEMAEQQQGPGRPGDQGGGEPFDMMADPSGSPAEIAQEEAEMTVRIAQAAQAARMMGKLSAGMSAFVDMAMKPKVDWADVLRRFVNKAAKRDYSFARPKRRFLSSGLYLPSLSGYGMGPLVVAVDQSGSISNEEIAQFGAEIRSQHQDCQPSELHVIYFDSEVQRCDRFEPTDEVTIGRYAGGGTAFSPIFRKIEELEVEPCACVVLTDLCCSDFGPEPDYPTLWVSTAMDRAPWGEVVMMRDER